MVSNFVLATHTKQGLLQDNVSVVSSHSKLLYYGNCSSTSLSPYSLRASLTCNAILLCQKEKEKNPKPYADSSFANAY